MYLFVADRISLVFFYETGCSFTFPYFHVSCVKCYCVGMLLRMLLGPLFTNYILGLFF